MRAFRSVTGRSPQPAKKTLKEVEEEFESQSAGLGPDDPARRDSRASGSTAATTTDGGGGGGEDKPPWETEEGTRGGRYSVGRPPFEQIVDRHH